MSAPPVDTVRAWLHRQLDPWDPDSTAAGDSIATRAGLDALVAAGALTPGDAAIWRTRLADRPGPAPVAARATCFAAAALLEERFAAPTGESIADESDGFTGALELCSAIGAADAPAWRERQRVRDGLPSAEAEEATARERNRGGTNVDLRSIHTGPVEAVEGYRLALLLCFADGIEVTIEMPPRTEPADWEQIDDWARWSLRDDVGTPYRPGGGGGGDTARTTHFAQAPADGASWLELTLDGHPEITFRVPL